MAVRLGTQIKRLDISSAHLNGPTNMLRCGIVRMRSSNKQYHSSKHDDEIRTKTESNRKTQARKQYMFVEEIHLGIKSLAEWPKLTNNYDLPKWYL